jgi:predicted amidohydrolase YtcJ
MKVIHGSSYAQVRSGMVVVCSITNLYSQYAEVQPLLPSWTQSYREALFWEKISMASTAFSPGFCQSTRTIFVIVSICLVLACHGGGIPAVEKIYYNGNVITVDEDFTVAQALAVSRGRFVAVGGDEDILSLACPKTEKIDLHGRTVVPGLIEGHAHPESASLSELERPLANPRTVQKCLDWIAEMVRLKEPGEWIIHPKLFATRLAEMRTPSLAELDSVAPLNPVFLNGGFGGVVNSAALRASGIGESTDNPGVLRDPVSGYVSGKLNYSAFDLLKIPAPAELELAERARALALMFGLYNRAGFTSCTSGATQLADSLLYQYMKEHEMLSVRMFLNVEASFSFKGRPLEEVTREVNSLGVTTGQGDEWIRIGALKTYIDGGILTGTAFMCQGWGERAREIFGISDPDYSGALMLNSDDFYVFARSGAEAGWKIAAHCAGDGGVDLMLDVFERVNKEVPLEPLRCSIIHGNFFTDQAIERAAGLKILADMQPAWFYKDADALLGILGEERMATFHPYRSLIGAGVRVCAGSDHMAILDDSESINPYNPWLAIWSMVSRRTERGTVIAPQEAISRKDALRCYTINNAWASLEENVKGSIEAGKYADMVIIDRDYLKCPEDEIKDIQVEMTMLGGKVVFER